MDDAPLDKQKPRKWSQAESLDWFALGVFAVTRVVLGGLGLATIAMLQVYAGLTRFVPPEARTGVMAIDVWLRWDSLWYLRIARTGYADVDFQALTPFDAAGFFPLYPLLLRYVAQLTGDAIAAGLIVSNVSAVLGLLMFRRLLQLDGAHEQARRALFYVCVFPTSFYLSTVASESLFFLLSVSSVYWARRGAWVKCGTAGALATLCRPVGILLLAPLACEYVSDIRMRRRAQWLSLLLLPAALAGYALFCRIVFGNALAFVHRQEAWRSAMSWPGRPLADYLRDPSLYTGQYSFIEPILAVAVIACLVVGIRRLRPSYAVYAALSVMLPLMTALDSFSRYMLVVFPLFILLGALGQREFADRAISIVLVSLMALTAVVYASGIWIA